MEPVERARRRVIVRNPEGTVVEIKCVDRLEDDDTAYLPELAEAIKRVPEKCFLLFETLEMTGYSPTFPLAHIPFFKQYLARIQKIAVAHTIPSVGFAIATVSLATGIRIKGFSDRPAALKWLGEA